MLHSRKSPEAITDGCDERCKKSRQSPATAVNDDGPANLAGDGGRAALRRRSFRLTMAALLSVQISLPHRGRASYNGITPASQAGDEGSSPFARSRFLQHLPF